MRVMKLSDVMWVQAGYGNTRRVMPFILNNNILCSLADDKLFQIEETKSMFDNIYEICQSEYGYSTVVMGNGSTKDIPRLDNSKEVPTVMNFRLPSIFTAVHKKEYAATKDITVNASEVKALSKNLTKQLAKSMENLALKEREM